MSPSAVIIPMGPIVIPRTLDDVIAIAKTHDKSAGLGPGNHNTAWWNATAVKLIARNEETTFRHKFDTITLVESSHGDGVRNALSVRMFGNGYVPAPYIQAEYERAKQHKWYMSARMICVNDLYSFDPDVKVTLEQFDDIIGRHFKQPKDGLGFDGSPVAHMWRSMIWPNNFL